MARSDRSESGFLVLADISGFTAFVTATELEHGAEVTGALLDGVMEALAPPFEIQELRATRSSRWPRTTRKRLTGRFWTRSIGRSRPSASDSARFRST